MKVQPPYFLDRSLPQRVEKYMNENAEVDVEEMTTYLINNYREFSQKKKNAFIKSVQKAYDYLIDLRGDKPKDVEILELTRKGNSSSFRASPRQSCSITPSNRTNGKNSDDPFIIDEVNIEKNLTPKATPPPTKKRALTSEGTLQRSKKVKRRFNLEKPTTNLDDLQGINGLEQILHVLLCSLMRPRTDFTLLRTALVTGPTGSGKSLLINALAGSVKASLLRVASTDFVEGISGDSEEKVKEAFDLALNSGPCILHLDRLDILNQRDSTQAKGLEKRICSKIASCIEDLKLAHKDKQILVIAETSYPERIDLDLRTAFEHEIFMPPLDEQARSKVLHLLTQDFCTNIDFSLISKHTTSFVAGDLKTLVSKAKTAAMINFGISLAEKSANTHSLNEKIVEMISKYSSLSKEELPSVTLEHFLNAIPEVTPVLKREGFPGVPEVTWNDIGGLEDIKNELKEKIIDPIIYPDLHKKFNATQAPGILLWGPPGCGKTLLAKAVANQAGINFYPINGPEILNKFQGESERAIREIFQRASKVSPCVVFFDEFDSICPNRNKSSESGSKSTIVNTLLAELEGIRSRESVYVLAATNRPDILDPAVTRPGRFDTLIYVDIPDLKGRESIFNACTKGGTLPKVTSDINFLDLATKCSNFTGADCSHLVYTASKLAIREIIQSFKINYPCELALSLRHFQEALNIVKPSVSEKERRHYALLQAKQGHSSLSLRKATHCPVFEVENSTENNATKPDETLIENK